MDNEKQNIALVKEQRILEIAVGCGAELISVCDGDDTNKFEFSIPNLIKFAKAMQNYGD